MLIKWQRNPDNGSTLCPRPNAQTQELSFIFAQYALLINFVTNAFVGTTKCSLVQSLSLSPICIVRVNLGCARITGNA